MPLPSVFHRRDPWWESDGPAARRARRRRTAVSAAAFAAAVVAIGASALAWSIELGVAGALGLHARLPFG